MSKNNPVIKSTSGLTSSGQPMSRVSVFNAVRAAAGPEYNTTIPMVDADSINHYSRVIATADSLRDEFTRVLVTKVVALYVQSAGSWDSTLRKFHAGPAPMGIGIEVVARNLIPIKNWNEIKNGDHVGELFKDHGDDIVALVQTIDELKYFPITVWQGELLYNSITTAEGLGAFIEDIFAQLRNSKEVYLYDRIKKTIFDYATNSAAEKLKVKLPLVNDEKSAKLFLVEAQATLGEFQFFSRTNNLQGIDMHSKGKTPVLITTPRMKAHIDINALAAMFNLEKENVSQYILLVDSLPAGVQAILTTDKFIQLYDRIDKITEQYHPVLDRTNYFNLLQVLVANNQFENARIFTTGDYVPPVDPVDPVDPAGVNYHPLRMKVEEYKSMNLQQSDYTAKSYVELSMELSLAETMLAELSASDQTEVDRRISSLEFTFQDLKSSLEFVTLNLEIQRHDGYLYEHMSVDVAYGIEIDIMADYAGFLEGGGVTSSEYQGDVADLIFTPTAGGVLSDFVFKQVGDK